MDAVSNCSHAPRSNPNPSSHGPLERSAKFALQTDSTSRRVSSSTSPQTATASFTEAGPGVQKPKSRSHPRQRRSLPRPRPQPRPKPVRVRRRHRLPQHRHRPRLRPALVPPPARAPHRRPRLLRRRIPSTRKTTSLGYRTSSSVWETSLSSLLKNSKPSLHARDLQCSCRSCPAPALVSWRYPAEIRNTLKVRATRLGWAVD